MSWPTPAEINEAVQNPQLCFHDPDLAAGQAETDQHGIPLARSGSNADVYCFTCGTERIAVKCFTRPIAHLEHRYQAIHNVLGRLQLPFTVNFAYQSQGIWLRDQWYPLVRMQWVDGIRLNEFAYSMIGRREVLHTLITILAKLGDWLDANSLGHCDLQHGNILLTPSNNGRKLAVRLVDYDGMWVPALNDETPQEFGHPDYQHPERLKTSYYGPAADRFSLLAIATGLRALIVHGKELWERYDNSVNVLFQQKDFTEPRRSPLFEELSRSKDNTLHSLCDALIDACSGPLEQVRPLSEVLNGATSISTGPMPAAEAVEVVPLPPDDGLPVVAGNESESRWDTISETEEMENSNYQRLAKYDSQSVIERLPELKKWHWISVSAGSLLVVLLSLWSMGAFRARTPPQEQETQTESQQSAKNDKALGQQPRDRKTMIQKTKEDYIRTIKGAREDLSRNFQKVLSGLSKGSNTELQDAIRTESKRFDTTDRVPWSRPMWPYFQQYIQKIQSAEVQLKSSYDEINKARNGKDETAVRELRAELEHASEVKVVATWKHQVDTKPVEMNDFYSNGKFKTKDKEGSWTLKSDGVLILTWPDPKVQGGAWIDTVQVDENGMSYKGQNKGGSKINATYVSD
jgi:serine/threonine protein kinase